MNGIKVEGLYLLRAEALEDNFRADPTTAPDFQHPTTFNAAPETLL